ncbi:MAG: DNA translocase FtsK [Faecalibacterium sp.]|jgi:S-DNA-T family DNA segregation ATPase FtsK/SpoIIIE|nr:DNA translocase FtsK [Faecalibacterium sp.]
MAAKKTTKRTPRKRRTKQQQSTALLQSLALFALGALFVVMLFVEGQALWLAARRALFGVFGAGMYLLGGLILYFAVRLAGNKPLGKDLAKAVCCVLILCGTAVVYSKMDITGLSGKALLAAFYENGQAGAFTGGVAALPVGGLLLHFCGRPAANIILVVLIICALMVVFGISPAEVWNFIAYYGGSLMDTQKQAVQDTEEGYRRRREERLAAQAARQEPEPEQLEMEPEEEQGPQNRGFFGAVGGFFANLFGGGADAPEEKQPADAEAPRAVSNRRSVMETVMRNASHAPVDISLGPDTAAQPAPGAAGSEPVVIGPGGTFGMNPLDEAKEEKKPFEPDVILPEGTAAPAANAAAGAIFPAAQAAASSLPSATAAPAAGDGGWVSLQAPAESAPVPSAAPDAGLDALADAALQKPAAAEQAAASAAPVAVPKAAYRHPTLDLFEKQKTDADPNARAELKANAEKLVATLESFGVKTRILDISRGPSVTRYELQPLAGVKISRITSLADDIALNLAVADVRIEAPIPGKPAVGIEVPNRKATSVAIRSIFESENFRHMTSPLTLALGKDIAGVAQVADLCKMPHLLIAGSTGSGKSVCVNSIIISFLYRASPEDVKLILIDPKVVELAEYNGIPHLLMPVVTEPRKAAGALCSAVGEMERRYHLFAENNVRDIKTYNKLAQTRGDLEKLPYIAIIIDELADLMMVAGKEVEDYICRIAQKARAAGMHLIVATQRPSVDVITGLIKANIPSRIAFAVSSQIDSRTILDGAGAEKLLGMGDMLFMPVGASKPTRIQGTYVKDEEISRVLDFVKQDGQAEYNEAMIAEMEKAAAQEKNGGASAADGGADEVDSMFRQCVECVIDAGQASTSLLQRRCKLGYARAARIMDEMEQQGIIGPYEGAKPRAVLVSRQQWIERSQNRTDPVPDELG